jgi:hypothetical protein
VINEWSHKCTAEEKSHHQTMQRVSWALVGASTLHDLTASLCKALRLSFAAAHVAVYVPGEDEYEMVVAAAVGIDEPSVGTGRKCSLKPDRRPGFHCGHTARAYASGETQIIDVLYSDAEFLPWRTVAREDGIVVSVPMKSQGRVVAVASLFVPGVDNITPSQGKLLESIAVAVSPSIAEALHPHKKTSSLDIAA